MSEIYQYQICSKVFRSKSSISKHERQLHPNNRIVPYGFCWVLPLKKTLKNIEVHLFLD